MMVAEPAAADSARPAAASSAAVAERMPAPSTEALVFNCSAKT